mgnify:CR=1 FL=1
MNIGGSWHSGNSDIYGRVAKGTEQSPEMAGCPTDAEGLKNTTTRLATPVSKPPLEHNADADSV